MQKMRDKSDAQGVAQLVGAGLVAIAKATPPPGEPLATVISQTDADYGWDDESEDGGDA